MTARRKPRDLGNGLVCASFGAAGEWLSFATVHPDAGFVEITGLPRFAPEWRGDPDAVRRYRSWMRREEHAFLHVEAGRAAIVTRQDAPRGTRGIVQRVVLRASRRDRPAGIRLRFNGRLGPPALAEITEVDPPTAEPSKSRLKAREGTLRVAGPGGPVIVQAWLRQGGAGARGSAEGRSDRRIGWKVLRRQMPTAVAWVDWPGEAEEVHLDLACTFDAPAPRLPEGWQPEGWQPDRLPLPRRASPDDRPAKRPLLVPPRLVKPLGRMNQHAASYVRSCTALQVTATERVVLTDHRILPLSWTRDAYWQARLLLATWTRGGHDEDARIVADHLRWLYLRCERPDGRWVRSHHADGRRKDHPLQADQQLYPLLELADYARATGGLPVLPAGASWVELGAAAWEAAERAIDPATGLIGTQENPADDVTRYPFLLSDQILLWHTTTRLAEVAVRVGLAPAHLADVAEHARRAVGQHFQTDGPLGPMWAYAVDARGGAERYMEANDLPTALAPLWGFCRPTDRHWRGSMRFAFDPANPGFADGPMGGLGSRHTPGTWPLGDIQAWVAFGLLGQQGASEAALERLTQVAFSDGMLPEAYDPQGSGAAVRHWFAWPGAVLGALLLEHASRETGS